jgi:CRP/FNR family cyclic AMP-dependent transcriptional regulator
MASDAALKQCSLFRGFTDTGLNIIASIGVDRVYPKGTTLFAENSAGDSLLVITSGRVELSTQLTSGQNVSLGELGQGDVLGELALLQPTRRMCTASAATEVAAMELRHADFQKLMAQKPQACAKLLMNLATTFGQKVLENREQFRSLLEKSR